MKKLTLILVYLTFLTSCFGQPAPDSIAVVYPQRLFRNAFVADCMNPEVTLQKTTGEEVYRIDPALDCELIKKALFLAGSYDGYGTDGTFFSTKMYFSKQSLDIVGFEIFEANELISNDYAVEMLGLH